MIEYLNFYFYNYLFLLFFIKLYSIIVIYWRYIMLFSDFYFYFFNLDKYWRNIKIFQIILLLISLLFIGVLIEVIKHKFIHKIRNEKIKKFMKNL